MEYQIICQQNDSAPITVPMSDPPKALEAFMNNVLSSDFTTIKLERWNGKKWEMLRLYRRYR